MKKNLFLIGMLLCLCITIQAKERVIERPAYIARNTDILEIEKIVQNDTATVIYFKAYFRPKNWIKINKQSYLLGNNGEKYDIKGSSGIPLDEKYYMPESGEAELQMIFPPLPDTVTSIDFSEGDTKGSWDFWGIELKSGKLPKLELPKDINTAKTNNNTTLPELEFKQGKATLRGQLLEYRPRMVKTLKCELASCINITTRSTEIDIAEDGTFSAEIPVITTTPASLYINGQKVTFYLAPEKETVVYINQREISRADSRLRKTEKPEGSIAYFGGYMSETTNELIGLTEFMPDMDYMKMFEKAAGKTLEELRTDFLQQRVQRLAEIDALKISPASKEILKGENTLYTINNINLCPAIYRQAYIMEHKLDRDQIAEHFKNNPINVPEDFYNVGYKEFTEINSPQLVYSTEYSAIAGNPYIRERIAKATGIDKGLFFELGDMADITQQIEDFKPATEEQLAQVATYKYPFFVDILKAKNEALVRTIEVNKRKTGFKMNEVGEVADEDLFASFIAPFKGKVILVDFWATWCGPCIMANKEMKPMKEDLKDKDIIYLYIAGENSPKEKWENMISDIGGEHFRVNQKQWEYLSATYGVRGVPTYLIINGEGEITYKQVGFPGVGTMKKELMKQLKVE